MMSSSSSSSSIGSEVIDVYTEVLVAMASRVYGQGRVFIHTDRMGGIQTGHGSNPNEFWRKVFEWTGNKKSNELIKVGLIINTKVHAADRIESFNPITVEKLNIPDLVNADLSEFDCLYFVGLPSSITSTITQKIADYVEDGGGLIIEYPNIGQQNINVLRNIENLYCYSDERLLNTYAYWTIDGANSYVYYDGIDIAFMSTLRQSDFSAEWTILMTNIRNVVTTTTTTSVNNPVVFDKNSTAGFSVSFTSAFQRGIVTLEQEADRTIVSAGDTINLTLTNDSANFEYISRDSTYATIILNGHSYRVGNVDGYFVWDILGAYHVFTYVGEMTYVELSGYLYAIIYDGVGSFKFSIEYSRYASSSSSSSSSSESSSSSSSIDSSSSSSSS